MQTWTPLGAGEPTREAIAERADFIRELGHGHGAEPLTFTLAGGNTRTGRVEAGAIETDGVRVDGELLEWTTIVNVERASGAPTKTGDELEVWIGCLAAYNAGRLHGEWVDATDLDELAEAQKRVLRTSPAPFADEPFIADYNAFGSACVSLLGEYPQLDDVVKIATALEEHGDAFRAWVELGVTTDVDDLVDRFEQVYRGEWESRREFAQQTVDDIGWGNVPAQPLYLSEYPSATSPRTVNVFEELASYLDWDAIARELFMGSYSAVEVDFKTYVFEPDA
jgi:antirestriction protein